MGQSYFVYMVANRRHGALYTGVTNDIVDRPDRCSYDPKQLIGARILCEGNEVVVTKADADVMRKIWNGPTDERGRTLWPGLPKGADPLWLAGAACALANWPYTLTVVRPTNKKLEAIAPGSADEQARALVVHWGRLHAVRSVLGLAATSFYLAAASG